MEYTDAVRYRAVGEKAGRKDGNSLEQQHGARRMPPHLQVQWWEGCEKDHPWREGQENY